MPLVLLGAIYRGMEGYVYIYIYVCVYLCIYIYIHTGFRGFFKGPLMSRTPRCNFTGECPKAAEERAEREGATALVRNKFAGRDLRCPLISFVVLQGHLCRNTVRDAQSERFWVQTWSSLSFGRLAAI